MRWALVVASLLTAVTFSADGSAVEENAVRRPERATAVQAGTPYYIEFRVAGNRDLRPQLVALRPAQCERSACRTSLRGPSSDRKLRADGNRPCASGARQHQVGSRGAGRCPSPRPTAANLPRLNTKSFWRRSSAYNPNSATGTPSPTIAITMLENSRERLDCERLETFSFPMPSFRHCAK